MKISLLGWWVAAFTLLARLNTLHADGIPEPGLIVYGRVVNIRSNPNELLTAGQMLWQIQSASGKTITKTVSLQNLNGQFSYILQVPMETLQVGGTSFPPSPNAFELPSADAQFKLTPAQLNGQPAAGFQLTASSPSASLPGGMRGTIVLIDITVSVTNSVPSDPVLKGAVRLVDGKFSFEIQGQPNQKVAVEGSEDLITWTKLQSIILNASAGIGFTDNESQAVAHRFYRVQLD